MEVGPFEINDNSNEEILLICNTPKEQKFPVASRTQVGCNASDPAGNIASCNFNVVVGVDCLGQWLPWECTYCPDQEGRRYFDPISLPILGGQPCPVAQTGSCPNPVPCFQLFLELDVGITDIANFLHMSSNVKHFVRRKVPQILALLDVNVINGTVEIAQVFQETTARITPQKSRRGASHTRRERGHVLFDVVIDMDGPDSEEAMRLIQGVIQQADLSKGASDVRSPPQPEDFMPTALSILGAHPLFKDAFFFAIRNVERKSLIPTTTISENTRNPDVGRSAVTASLPFAVGISIASVVLISGVVIALVFRRYHKEEEPVIIPRRMDSVKPLPFQWQVKSLHNMQGIPTKFSGSSLDTDFFEQVNPGLLLISLVLIAPII